MSGMYSPIIFYPAAFALVALAILMIIFKNIFYSLLSAIGVFFLAGMFFYILGSEYNAVIQIAIYGVAVPVILGLAVMFTNSKKEEKPLLNLSNYKYLMLLIGGVFILGLLYLTMTSLVTNPIGFNISENISNTSLQSMSAISHGIFVNYVWAFELIALILTIIVVGIAMFD